MFLKASEGERSAISWTVIERLKLGWQWQPLELMSRGDIEAVVRVPISHIETVLPDFYVLQGGIVIEEYTRSNITSEWKVPPGFAKIHLKAKARHAF